MNLQSADKILEFIVCWSIGLSFSSVCVTSASWLSYKVLEKLGVL